MTTIARVRRRVLLALLIFAFTLFCLDRYAAYVHQPASDSNAVTIYTTQRCPYCMKLRADLQAGGIGYKEYDVEKSFQGFLGMWALRARGVPVSVVGPHVVYGYRVDELAQAFQELGIPFFPQLYNSAP